MAIGAFFYAFVVMLLGVVVLAAGLAFTIAAVDVRTSVQTAALLGGGAWGVGKGLGVAPVEAQPPAPSAATITKTKAAGRVMRPALSVTIRRNRSLYSYAQRYRKAADR